MTLDFRVTGGVRYAQDVELPGMLYGRILRSPHPHARIVRVDASAVPDGLVVLIPQDVRDLGRYGCQIKDQTVLAVDRARYAGDPVHTSSRPPSQRASEACGSIAAC